MYNKKIHFNLQSISGVSAACPVELFSNFPQCTTEWHDLLRTISLWSSLPRSESRQCRPSRGPRAGNAIRKQTPHPRYLFTTAHSSAKRPNARPRRNHFSSRALTRITNTTHESRVKPLPAGNAKKGNGARASSAHSTAEDEIEVGQRRYLRRTRILEIVPGIFTANSAKIRLCRRARTHFEAIMRSAVH